jgi:dihydrofolate synthase/folylpolyglutamate synthase
VTYPEAIQFLYGLRLFGAKFGLENTFKLAALVGNPQKRLAFIHVAGTNGKGSTCAMLESIYRAAGLRVGLFTSPHLVSFRERIQVNRQTISEHDVVRLVTQLQPPLKQFPADHHPTFFEVITIMALQFFAEQQCDLVVWETGLGGRLDATNIVTPKASVITNIAFDHQQWLGGTLEKIAGEKAGIIKPGVPVVTATDAPEALAVIETTARENQSSLTVVGPSAAAQTAAGGRPMAGAPEPLHEPGKRSTFNFQRPMSKAGAEQSALKVQCWTLKVEGSGAQGANFSGESLPALPLPGDHQKLNAALALATVAVLQPQIPITLAAIRAGLAAVRWPGRLQLITTGDGRKILLDGAHNAAGATVLRAALEKDFAGPRPVIIFGALADKKWEAICEILAPVAARVITVPVASERTADAAALARAFQAARPALAAAAGGSLTEALNACKQEPFVLITGSLYLVGEALERLGAPPAGPGERGLNEWTAPPIQK